MRAGGGVCEGDGVQGQGAGDTTTIKGLKDRHMI